MLDCLGEKLEKALTVRLVALCFAVVYLLSYVCYVSSILLVLAIFALVKMGGKKNKDLADKEALGDFKI